MAETDRAAAGSTDLVKEHINHCAAFYGGQSRILLEGKDAAQIMRCDLQTGPRRNHRSG